HIPVSLKGTRAGCGSETLVLCLVSSSRIPATCSLCPAPLARCAPLQGSRSARVPSCLRFIRQRGDDLAVFPAGHPLVVTAPPVLLSPPVRIADAQAAHALPLAEGDHPHGALVLQRTDLPPFARAHAASGSQELAPASRARRTALALAFPGVPKP